MRKIVFFTVLCVITLTACALETKNDTFEVKGKIGNYNAPAKIYLQYVEKGEIITQSQTLEDGRFSFSGRIQSPTDGRLVIIPDGSPINNQQPYEHSLPLIIGNEKISVAGAKLLADAAITGSPLNDDLKKLKDLLKVATDKKDNLFREYYSSSTEKQQSANFQQFAQSKLIEIDREIEDVYRHFIRSNPDSYVSLMALMDLGTRTGNMGELESLYRSLSKEIQNTADGKNFALQITSAKNTAIGSVAPDFTQGNPEGKSVSLSDFRGKYLLLDFWASWCGPCRKENPLVVKAYNLYKDKNFEILGVSLDNPGARQNWLNAIQQDGITWPQVSDLKGWQNSVALLYQVQSIPQNFLLDPKGVIIAKNLRGEELMRKLKEVLE